MEEEEDGDGGGGGGKSEQLDTHLPTQRECVGLLMAIHIDGADSKCTNNIHKIVILYEPFLFLVNFLSLLYVCSVVLCT